MLKQLNIRNIILIEETSIVFEAGFNVLSGETGSGKSAIMAALALVTGARADLNILRHGADKGYVEAAFDISKRPDLVHFLDESGITVSDDELLLVRRELSGQGKSRAFINNQMANLPLLRTVGTQLVDIVGQHANQQLFSTEQHRRLLDCHGNLTSVAADFARQWQEEGRLRKKLAELSLNEAERIRLTESYYRELEEIQAASLQEGEEESLFNEYTLLTNSEEIARKAQMIYELLSGEEQPVVPALAQHKLLFSSLAEIDPQLADSATSFANAIADLQEAAHTLRNYIGGIEHNPERAEAINQRLALINKLKRKYGTDIAAVLAYGQSLAEKLAELDGSEQHAEALTEEIEALHKRNDELAAALTQQRQAAAVVFESQLTAELRSLNMPQVNLLIKVSPQPRSAAGDDLVEFFIQPNIGERMVPVRECASGGELSRLMLAVQTLMSGKGHNAAIVFDEIDANIGGETAVVVGGKLKAIGRHHQVLCITHFPQVAKQADHHIQIAKTEKNGRTITTVTPLTPKTRETELARMAGMAI